MSELLETLRAISNADTQVERLKRQVERKPGELRSDEIRLEQAQTKLKAVEARNKALDVELRSKEKKVSEAEAEKLRTVGLQNQASSNEEYQAHQRKLDSLSASIETLETEILEGMERRDELARELAEHRRVVEVVKESVAQVRARLKEEQQALEEKLAEAEAKRAECLKAIPGDDRGRYETASKRYGLATIVGLLDGVCQGCGISIRPNDRVQVEGGAKMVTCPNCGRVLIPS